MTGITESTLQSGWGRIAGAIVAVAISFGAAGGSAFAQGAATSQKGGTAITVLNQDPTTLSPALSPLVPTHILGCSIFEGLTELGTDYKIRPVLAKSWTISPDGLTYEFILKDAQWHDGQPFTSEDVKVSILEVNSKYSAVFGPAGRVIDSIETPAKDKVVFKLKQPFGPFLIALGCAQGGAIMPAHLFKGTVPTQNPAGGDKAVGTGPFKLSEWRRGEFVKLVRNDKYHMAGKPYLDEVIGKVVTVAASRTQGLQSGEVDAVFRVPTTDVPTLRRDPKVKIVQADAAPLMTFAFLNVSRKPLDDRRVRQALFRATDRDYLLKNVFFGVGKAGITPFTTDIGWATAPDLDFNKMYPFDTAKANALLDEAGYKRGPDGMRFSLKVIIFANNYPEFQQAASAMKSTWKQIGVDLSIEALEDATLVKRVFTDRDFDVALQTYTTYADPALGIARIYASSAIGRGFGNASGYSNSEVDSLLQQAEKPSDFDERGKFYKQAQAIIADDAPIIMLRQYLDFDGASVKLNGIWGVAGAIGVWRDGWMAK
jgi:peptide/nickel transport system substrate-binding protein